MNRYPALKIISNILMVLAWINGVGSILIALSLMDKLGGLMSSLIVIGGLILALFLAAGSELIHVFIDIEINTRKTSEYKNRNINIDQKVNNNSDIDNNDSLTNANYPIPKFEINKISEKASFGNLIEEHHVIFEDGLQGDIFIFNSTRIYFLQKVAKKEKKQIYSNVDYCVNALYHFLKTGNILKEGFVRVE